VRNAIGGVTGPLSAACAAHRHAGAQSRRHRDSARSLDPFAARGRRPRVRGGWRPEAALVVAWGVWNAIGGVTGPLSAACAAHRHAGAQTSRLYPLTLAYTDTPRLIVTLTQPLGGGGAPRGYPCGGEMGSHGPPQAPIFFIFAPFSTCFHRIRMLRLRQLIATMLSLRQPVGAADRVPCCTTDHLHSSRP